MIDFSPLWISLRIAAIATAVVCFLGIAAARFMQDYRGPWRSLLEGLFLAPMVLPPTVLGFLLLLLLGKNSPLGSLLSAAGISVVFTWYAAVLTASVVAFPLMYKTTLGAFEQIDSSLQRAARTLGASEFTIFWRITLPLALPGLLAGATLSFARALGEFGATLMLAGNIPGRTQTLPMAIYFAVEGGDFTEAALWSAVVFGLSLGGLMLVNYRTSRLRGRRLHHGRKLFSSVRKDKKKSGGTQTREKTSLYSLPNAWARMRARMQRKFMGGGQITYVTPLVTPLLEVDICKQLPGFKLAVNFVVDGTRPLGLLGASGAGKSLILRYIAGIETPDTGRIVLNGRVLFDSEKGINLPSCDRKVGLLFQNYALFPHLTVAQNIAFGLRHSQSAEQLQAIVQQQLAAVHIESLAQRYPHELSGGQQQRVALARALASQPEILLLDEPFSALDTHLRSRIERQLFNRLQHYQGMTLLVTHNLEEAYRFCDRLLVVEQGRTIAYDRKHQIFEQPHSIRVAQLTGCKNFSSAIAKGSKQVYAEQWQCNLQTVEPVPVNLIQIGIRAHQIKFFLRGQISTAEPPPNTFPCWLAATSETPHRMTLYLKLHTPSTHEKDYHLQAEVFKEKWNQLKDQPFPWRVQLDPMRLILLEAE